MTDMTGKIIAKKYRITDLIGTGGMANVYRAVSLANGREVAIKILKEEHKNDPKFLRRFEKEAQAVLSLSQENIVKSYDVGEDKDTGSHYIILEYVKGETLKALIEKENKMDVNRAVNITCQVLNALAHAHEKGIIHRDIKPQNVIITPKGKAKLTDFGIAQIVESSTKTFMGASVLGSVHYLSPEQAKGEEATAESDIYSVAIMLYELLTGELPFLGEAPVTIALKHIQEQMNDPRYVNPDISPAMSKIIIKAASKDPENRYKSAMAMKHDLLRAIKEPNGDFVKLEETNETFKPATGREKMHRSIIAIGIFVLLAIIMFTVMFFIVRSIKEAANTPTEGELVPTLVGKKYTTANDLAKLRGYKLEITGWVQNDEYPENTIIEQNPTAGTTAKTGDTIMVVISSGSDNVIVPELSGQTIIDAARILAEKGLEIGDVVYEVNDKYEDGKVFRQLPLSNSSLFEGDTVDVWVCGYEQKSEDMPKYIDMQIIEAVEAARRIFDNIRVRYSGVIEGELIVEGTVIAQTPEPGTSVIRTTPVELTVYGLSQQIYSADIAFNVDVAENNASIIVTYIAEAGIEVVIYEDTIHAGKQIPISFIGWVREQGTYECVVYRDNIEIKRMNVKFTYKG